MKNIDRRRIIYLSLLFWFFFPFAAFAVSDPPASFTNPLGNTPDNILTFFELIIDGVVVPIGAVAVAFFIIWSGFLFVMAQGNEEKLKQAKNTFMYTVIGAAILLGAWTITEVIQQTICQIAEGTPTLCP